MIRCKSTRSHNNHTPFVIPRNEESHWQQQTIAEIAYVEESYEKLTSTYVNLLIGGKEDEDINTTILKKKTKIIL